MQNYSLLILSYNNIPNNNTIFQLHEGENIIGTNKDIDICLKFLEKENDIEPIHAKITLNKQSFLHDIGIKILKSNKAYIQKEECVKKLEPEKEYELPNNSILYLNDIIRFKLIKGTIEEIKDMLFSLNLQNEFQKWYKNNIHSQNKTILNLNKNEYELKIEKENKNNLSFHSNKTFKLNNYEIIKNDFFSILKQNKFSLEDNIKSSNKFLTESFSTFLSSNKYDNKKSSIFGSCKKNLLDVFNVHLDEENLKSISKEKNKLISSLLGENGLDDIIKSTNYKKIKTFDKLFYSFSLMKKYL